MSSGEVPRPVNMGCGTGRGWLWMDGPVGKVRPTIIAPEKFNRPSMAAVATQRSGVSLLLRQRVTSPDSFHRTSTRSRSGPAHVHAHMRANKNGWVVGAGFVELGGMA
jgi:hypothetical protein